MTTPHVRPLDVRTEITAPDGRRFVTADCGFGYLERDGYSRSRVRGFDHPQGWGFVITERPDLQKQDAV